jgi:DNA-binding beta-propeller fold protein YncE
VLPIDLTTSHVGGPITVGTNPEGLAFSPDGSMVYVADNNANGSGTSGVTPITVAANAAGAAITVGPHPFSIAITPDGSHAYVGDAGSGSNGKVYPIALPSGTVGSPIMIGGSDLGIAITPDGSNAYVANGASVTPIALPANTPGMPITVSGGAFGIAATPDSKTVYVTNDTAHTVTPIDTASKMPGTPIQLANNFPRGIAITPDQAPVANFTVASAPAGSATSFDASSSTVRFGTIVRYDWNFGDGQLAPNAGPTPSHVYAAAGSYTATVTETDSNGTSTTGEVYTGQTASSVGNQSAQTSRSVIVSPGPAPAFGLSPSHLDFGPTAVGKQSAAQTLTITNTGNAPLVISGSAISGPQAGDFKLTADNCTGRTFAAGASCTAGVAYTPTAGGASNAQVAFTDNASGSPHTGFLSGSGTRTGIVSGRVLDGTQTSAPPVDGATVQICPQGQLGVAACQYTTTGASGAYSFGGLRPGAWAMEVTPPTQALFGASAVLSVSAGTQTQDFTLRAPVPLPAQVTVNSAAGLFSGGIPIIYWNGPFAISHPLDVPFSGTPGSTLTIVVEDAIYLAGGGLGAQTGLSATFRYDGSGHPALSAVAPMTTPPGPNPALSPPGAAGASDVSRGHGDGGPVARPAQGGLQQFNLADLLSQIAGTSSSSPTVTTTGNINQAAHGDVTLSHLQYAQPTGYIKDPNNPSLLIPICPKGFHVAVVDITLVPNGRPIPQRECVPDPDPNQPQNSNAKVDPSGLVTTNHGVPLAGVQVTLQRSLFPHGPFTPPRVGSTVMAPSVNRERTNPAGHYGWDVIPGYYRVLAARPGCTAASGHGRHAKQLISRVVKIPPAVTNLNLVLSCPHVRRSASQTILRAHALRGVAGHLLTVTVTVRARRGRTPHGTIVGTVTLRSAGRIVATLPLDPRTGSVTTTLRNASPRRLRASYSGDAFYTG